MKYPYHVFKFGGASVRDAKAIRNVAAIVRPYCDKRLLVVVSAMGKTTNALERVVKDLQTGTDVTTEIISLKEYHNAITSALFSDTHPIRKEIETMLDGLPPLAKAGYAPDQLYDQVVSFGELISTRIVAAFLAEEGLPAEWVDARHYIKTDDTYREGKVDWAMTEKKIRELAPHLDGKILITQGFIGSTPDGFTTTLGREGSDYTAAIFGSCLGAENVTIWKDVPGVMNADPKRIPDATPFRELPFREAAEMTYYGASVIHPKTIKPLANRGIPLLVKNFDNPSLPGTRIHETRIDRLPPLIVFKENQCLISCAVTDYTFVDEQQLGVIFHAVSRENLKINVMQNSAISFSFCVDFRENKVLHLIEELSEHFKVYYNTGLTLITVKNYDEATNNHYRGLPGVILEQSSRSTLQVLVKP
jgi:aspartate kinase